MSMRIKMWLMISLLFNLLLLTAPVFAQDSAETPTAIVVQTVKVDSNPLNAVFIAEGIAILLLVTILIYRYRQEHPRQQVDDNSQATQLSH